MMSPEMIERIEAMPQPEYEYHRSFSAKVRKIIAEYFAQEKKEVTPPSLRT